MDFEKGNYYHIFNRGNNSQQVFFNRDNYLFFLRKAKKQIDPFASIVSWCLMPTHFHFVVFVKNDKIQIEQNKNHDNNPDIRFQTFNQSIGVLLSSYTKAIQRQEKITGSLFQKRTKAQLIHDEIEIEPSYWNTTFGASINVSEGKSYLETCIEYVHLNPVYSHIVEHETNWEFSSYKDFMGLREGKLIDYDLLLAEKLINPATRHPNRSRKTSNTIIIGIGSNIDADSNISKMLEILKEKVVILKVSSFITTKPIGIKNQPDYKNGAVKVESGFNQEELTKLLKSIEDQMGRDRTIAKFGPRNIDLDIVVWNGEIVDPDYYTRDFLQKSVQEIS